MKQLLKWKDTSISKIIK